MPTPPKPTATPPATNVPFRSAAVRERRALSAETGAIRSDGEKPSASLLVAAFRAAGDADPRELTHGFHSYPARFHPRLVRTILAARAKVGTVICDPFCGSGTTLVETLLIGGRGIGSDLNPLALELARIKALAPTAPHLALPDELIEKSTALCEESIRRVKARARTKTPGTQWDDPAMYASHVFRELVGLRELFDEPMLGRPLGALSRRALLLCLSSILIKVSRTPSETAAGTHERSIGKGLPSRLFQRKATELANGLRALFERTPAGAPSPMIYKADARKLKPIKNESVDLIVTSPPYLGTYDYAAHHTRRLGWLGLDIKGLEVGEIGARRASRGPTATPEAALAGWQRELDEVVSTMARVLRPGASAFVVIGDSRIGERAIPGDRALRLAAERAGLAIRASASEERGPSKRRGQRNEEHLIEFVRR